MRVLLYAFGSRGDVQPFVALGSALRARGHEVHLCTGLGFADAIEGAGLCAHAVQVDYRALLAEPDVEEALHSWSAKWRAFRSLKGLMHTQYSDMWRVAKDVSPQLIVAHPKGFAAQLMAQSLGVPCVMATLQPNFAPTGDFPHMTLPFVSLGTTGNRLSHVALNRLTLWGQNKTIRPWVEASLGAGASHRIHGFHGYAPNGAQLPILHAYSAHLVPKPSDWDAREHVTGYWFTRSALATATATATDWQPPPSLLAFLNDGPAPVYVGFGSMSERQGKSERSELVIAALKAVGQRGILATGWGGMTTSRPRSDIYVLEQAPHAWLFPRCCAVVHHGGAGTTHEGLRWGRPTVICPAGMDQPFWGHRVEQTGAGTLAPPLRKLRKESLATALRSALTAQVSSRAVALGEAIRAEHGAQAAADCLTELVHTATRSI